MQAPPLQPPALPAEQGILVVDDHDLVRQGMRTLVHSQAAAHGRTVPVLEARSLQEALALYRSQGSAIRLVLLDLNLPDAHGLSGLTTFMARFPQARVVVLSGAGDPAMVRLAMAYGAQAFLAKSGDLQEVVHYIRSLGLLGSGVARDEPSAMPPPLLKPPPARRASGAAHPLTERQAQVLEWILAGRSNREIALQAHLSEGTVKNHVSALLLLFGVRSRAQLISQLR
jgi:DNA-binding NarL/FixJ family response regulator